MNVRHETPLQGHLLPDPWTTAATSYPPREFDRYYNFVRTMVQEHTNRDRVVSKLDALKFMAFMATHGLSLRTVGKILGHLWTEKIKKEDLEADRTAGRSAMGRVPALLLPAST